MTFNRWTENLNHPLDDEYRGEEIEVVQVRIYAPLSRVSSDNFLNLPPQYSRTLFTHKVFKTEFILL